jgi:flagellar biosynthetic protein FliS
MKSNPARTYRQLSAQGASPIGVIIQAYDQIVSALGGAIRAIEDRDIQKKTTELNHALALISHLKGDLDFKAGGKVARVMDHFYALARTQILEGSARLSPEILQQVITQFASQREAWEQVERANSTISSTPDQGPPRSAGREAPTTPPSARWSA